MHYSSKPRRILKMMTNTYIFIAYLLCCLTLLTTEAIPLSVQGTADDYFEGLERTNSDSTVKFQEGRNSHWNNETSDVEDLDQIAGGSIVDQKDYQFMVRLTSNLGMVCGGTIISANPRIVLTAAHCLYGASGVWVSLFKGSYGNVDVKRYARLHPSYRDDDKISMYDIALLYLPNQISAPYYGIIPPYLNGKYGVTYDSAGQSVFALGWGITSTGGSTSPYLRRADLNIKGRYGTGYCQTIRNGDIQLCAGPAGTQLTGACRGDSGGPLIVPGYSYILAGIVSYGGRTCGENSVYTRVSGFINWIDTTVNELRRSNM